MIASLEYIERKFKEYNELCFEGKLNPTLFLKNRDFFREKAEFLRDIPTLGNLATQGLLNVYVSV